MRPIPSDKRVRLGDFFGAFGDLGTLLPLSLGAILFCGLNPFSVFFTFGIIYIATGFYFGIPVPVQPLKAATAIAIASGLGPDYIRATSLIMALLILLFAISGRGRTLYRIFPHPVVRGLQMAVGLLLIKTGYEVLTKGQIFIGRAISFSPLKEDLSLYFLIDNLQMPSSAVILSGALLLVIPQIPLTLGNAIVATEDVAICYFGEKGKKLSIRNLSFSISMGNFLSFLFGGIPVCHGSGGMTAHYRMGARTGLATVVTGLTMIVISLFSWKLKELFLTTPFIVFLGISLMYTGLNHCLLSKDINKSGIIIVSLMAATGLFTSNLTYSLIPGYLVFFILEKWNQNRYKKTAFLKRRGQPKEYLFDAYGRRVTYLRISVTDFCNLRCIYCKRRSDLFFNGNERILEADAIIKIATVASSLGIEKIRITGGEPLIRKDILEIVRGISSIDGIRDLSLTTNGVFLYELAHDLKKAGLMRINVSLDTLRRSRFQKISGCALFEKVLDGLREAKRAGIEPVKLNVVVMKGLNDDEIEDFVDFSISEGVIIRFIELIPVGWNDEEWRSRYVSREEIIERIKHRLEDGIAPFSRRGDPARYYRLREGGEIGIISPVSHSFCNECNRLRVTSDGHLRSCMVMGREIDLKGSLNSNNWEKSLRDAFRDAVLMKPGRGFYVERALNVSRGMFEIGG